MNVWKVVATDSNSVLNAEAIKILQRLEDHKNRLEIEEYNKLLKKLAKKFPDFRSQIYSLKIRNDNDGNKTCKWYKRRICGKTFTVKVF